MATSSSNGTSGELGPNCPEWCSEHQVHRGSYSGEDVDVITHRRGLFEARPPLGDAWMFALRIQSSDILRSGGAAVGSSAALILAERGSEFGGRVLSPAQARELAAALIDGASVVEAGLTSECASCGCPVVDQDAGGCVSCRLRAARPTLAVVR